MSHLDVAMASTNISRIANGTDLDDTIGNDHLPIVITVNNPAVIEESSQPHWLYRKADFMVFKDVCKRLLTTELVTDDVTTSFNHVVCAILQVVEKNVQSSSRPIIQQESRDHTGRASRQR